MTALIFGLAPDLRDLTTAQLQRKYEELFGQASHSNHKDYRLRQLLLARLLGGGPPLLHR